MLGYHFPLGYFVLTLVTVLDPIEGNGSNGSKFAYEFFQQHLVNSLTTRTMEAMVANLLQTFSNTLRWKENGSNGSKI
jgi:hypothetical protein